MDIKNVDLSINLTQGIENQKNENLINKNIEPITPKQKLDILDSDSKLGNV